MSKGNDQTDMDAQTGSLKTNKIATRLIWFVVVVLCVTVATRLPHGLFLWRFSGGADESLSAITLHKASVQFPQNVIQTPQTVVELPEGFCVRNKKRGIYYSPSTGRLVVVTSNHRVSPRDGIASTSPLEHAEIYSASRRDFSMFMSYDDLTRLDSLLTRKKLVVDPLARCIYLRREENWSGLLIVRKSRHSWFIWGTDDGHYYGRLLFTTPVNDDDNCWMTAVCETFSLRND